VASSSDSSGIEKLIRSDLMSFVGYSARKSPDTLVEKVDISADDIVKLDANENPYGCSPRVNQALAVYPYISVYPDNEQTKLKRLIAEYVGVGAEYIVASNGSNQLIDLIFRLFVQPGEEVVTCAPSFSMFRFSADICGGRLVEVPRDEEFAIDMNATKKAINRKTKLILVDNPNNPSGSLSCRSDIIELINIGLPILVDEAYFEFAGETVASLVKRYDNLMVSRSFSKWAGLAGLRIGYGVFPPKIAGYLQRIKVPYNVSVAAQVAVEESLKDVDYLMGGVRAIIKERDRLFGELGKIKWLKPFPSQANFILCSVMAGSASQLQQDLERRGILVRYFNQPLLKNYVRISVGKSEHTDALIKALRELGEK